ncbi:molybdopterin-dependent oxidoreductase [Rubritalea marina]|uniref:molybdopterin-dependent oxidoreductase n=1 Tax=Rubritalea marina TaxID=361055 RepID=UPI000527B767|nr:molybdopterin-dependent oxidoreductase [Rubritalea marina]
MLERRDFLKVSAMAAATSAAAAKAGQEHHSPVVAGGLKWDKAPCRFCGTGCHVKVGVRDGKVEAIAGHEGADVNKGLLCMKGYHVGGILYGEDRLTQPQLRVNGKLENITWDEAINIMAQKIYDNPKGFANYGSGQWTVPEGYAAQKFIKGGLSNNHIDPNARLCMASAVTGYVSTYGVDEPAGCYDDLDVADVVILWGNNPAEMHPVLFSRIIDRRSRGETVTIVDIGTRRTRSTEFADEFMEMKPQGDMAIANCISHYLIEDGSYDKAFVEKHCNFRIDVDERTRDLMGKASSFEEYREKLKPYTYEYVSELSGLSVEQLQKLVGYFADHQLKITSLWCMGMNQHTRGTAINRLVHGIHLLSGHFGTPGNAPTSLTGQPSACGTAREVGTLCHALPGGRLVAKPDDRADCEKIWKLPAGTVNPKPGYHTVKMWEKFCTPTSEGGDITTMFVQVTNPGQTLPNLAKLFTNKEALKDKFLIVSEVYPTATTALADLILPAAMWVEKNGVYGNSERRTQQWFKMVEPPGEAREDTWMTLAVARKLYDMGYAGMKDKHGDFLFKMTDEGGDEVAVWDYAHYHDINVDRVLYDEYRDFTFKKHKDLAPYDVLAQHTGLRWPVVQGDDGVYRETKFRFSEFSDSYVGKGKGIQFYHSVTKDDKAQIWFCPYEAPPEVPDEAFPMWLSTGRVIEHWHSGTMTMRVKELHNAMPSAYVELHPDDARDKGIGNGDLVKVVSRRGEMVLPAWVNGRSLPPQGSVFVPFFDETKLINEVTLEAFCPVSFEPDYKKCAVRIEKVG